MNRSRFWIVAVAGITQACAPPSEQISMLLLDADARAAGHQLELGSWEGAPITPITLAMSDKVVLKLRNREHRITLQPGALGHIRGPAGELEWRLLGPEVREDALRIRGREPSVREFAGFLGGTVDSFGPDEWTIIGSELVSQSAWATAPQGVEETAPVEVSTARPLLPNIEGPQWVLGIGATESISAVGVYAGESGLLILDAIGGFTRHDKNGCQSISGTFLVNNGDVFLTSAALPSGARLIRTQGLLKDSSGDSFAPLVEESR